REGTVVASAELRLLRRPSGARAARSRFLGGPLGDVRSLNSLTVRRRWRTRSRMPMHRPLRAIVLYGGWLLLTNPREQQLGAPLSQWKKVHEYDTAYDCQRKREEEVQTALHKDEKKGAGAQTTPSEIELRYRCERVEHIPPKR